MKAVLGEDNEFSQYTGLSGFGAAAITVLGIVCSCITFCTVKCCPEKFKGCFRKCSVVFTFIVYLVVAIIWLIVGSALWLLPNRMGDDFIEEKCAAAVKGDFSDMKLDLSLMQYDMKDVFEMFKEFDDVYAESINGYMCTDFCICPGKPGDSHYEEYKAVKEETYNKYGRTWIGFNS